MPNDAVINIQVGGGADIRRLSTAIERLNTTMRELTPSIRGMSRALNQSSTAMKRTASQAITAGKAFRTYASRISMATQKTKQYARTQANTMGGAGAFAGRLGVLGQTASLIPGPMGMAAMSMQQVSFSAALAKTNGLELGNVIRRTVLPAIGALAFGAAVAGAISKFAELEKTMVRTARSAGRAGDNVGDLVGRLRELSNRAPLASMNEAADATLKLARSGVSLDEAFGKAGETALAFAEVVDVPVQQAITQLQSAVNQTNRSLQDISDIVVMASRETQASIDQISQAFSRGSKAARQMGLSAENVGSIAAAATRAGLSGREAGTSLRSMARFALRLGTAMETAQQKTAIAELGIRDAVEAFKAGETNVLDLMEAAEEAGATAAEMGGIFGRSGQKLSIALRGNIDDVQSFSGELEKAEGTTMDAAEALEDTLAGAVENLGIAFSNLLGSIGELIQTSGIIGWLEDIVIGIDKAVQKTEQLIEKFKELQETRSEPGVEERARGLVERQREAGGFPQLAEALRTNIKELREAAQSPLFQTVGIPPGELRNQAKRVSVILEELANLPRVGPQLSERLQSLSESVNRPREGAMGAQERLQFERLLEDIGGGEAILEQIANQIENTPPLSMQSPLERGTFPSLTPEVAFPGTSAKSLEQLRSELKQMVSQVDLVTERLSLTDRALQNFKDSVKEAARAQREQPQDLQGFLQNIFRGFVDRTAQDIQSLVRGALDKTAQNLQKSVSGIMTPQLSQAVSSALGGTGTQVAQLLGGLASAGFVSFATQGISIIAKEMARIREEFIESQKQQAARQAVPAGVFGQVEPPKGASAATGGTVKREGLVKLHQNERVVPAAEGGGGMTIHAPVNLTVNSSGDPKKTREEVSQTVPLIEDQLERQIDRILTRKLGRGTIRREGMEGTA